MSQITYSFNPLMPILTWTREAGTPVAMATGHGYINAGAPLTTFVLPVSAVVGTVIAIVGEGVGLFQITQNAGQNIQYGSLSSTVGVGGSVKASHRYDTIRLVCRVENTTWAVTAAVGVFNIL